MDKNKIRLDYNNMMADVIGERGFTKADFDAVKDRVDFAVRRLRVQGSEGTRHWLYGVDKASLRARSSC